MERREVLEYLRVMEEKREKREISEELFYSESNMEHLRRGIAALDAGKGIVREPIEVDE